MYKKIFIIILLSMFLLKPANAEQFNRYEVNDANKFNYSNTGKPTAIELLVDFSGSMGWAVDITKKTLVYIVPQLKGSKLGLRLFGGELKMPDSSIKQSDFNIDCNANPSNARECRKMRALNAQSSAIKRNIDSCKNTQLVTPIKSNNKVQIINGFDKGHIGDMTPIELGLKEAVKDLSSIEGRKKIILITDGYESCGGNPCSYIRQAVVENKNLIIDVIIIGDNDNLKCLAEATGGKYYKVVDDNKIIDALEKTFDVPKGTADKVRKYKFVDVDKVK